MLGWALFKLSAKFMEDILTGKTDLPCSQAVYLQITVTKAQKQGPHKLLFGDHLLVETWCLIGSDPGSFLLCSRNIWRSPCALPFWSYLSKSSVPRKMYTYSIARSPSWFVTGTSNLKSWFYACYDIGSHLNMFSGITHSLPCNTFTKNWKFYKWILNSPCEFWGCCQSWFGQTVSVIYLCECADF